MADLADIAQGVIEQHLNDAIQRTHNTTHKKAQLGKRDCIECGATIPLARRRAVPTTEHCVACASRHEVLDARHSTSAPDTTPVEYCFDNTDLLVLDLPDTQ